MSLIESILVAVAAMLVVAALVGLLYFDIGRNAPGLAAPAGGIIQKRPGPQSVTGTSAVGSFTYLIDRTKLSPTSTIIRLSALD